MLFAKFTCVDNLTIHCYRVYLPTIEATWAIYNVTGNLLQVLLVASTFMTPLEARNNTNRNSVRMFDTSKLSSTTAKQKWDRVKIVCTQPFNKVHVHLCHCMRWLLWVVAYRVQELHVDKNLNLL